MATFAMPTFRKCEATRVCLQFRFCTLSTGALKLNCAHKEPETKMFSEKR